MRNLNVLYVEDDEITRMVLSRQLSAEYSNIFQAADGKEGLRIYKEILPDVVITDLTMPVMSGMEMIMHILEIRPDQPIIVLTGCYDESQHFLDCVVISKPVVATDIFKTVESLGI
ncbi:response regulator receiver protein [Denitrovibrio acetiphilus DSM 12809]|uniref:Response regulator receiver protein n=1 Tax=Denitrovibrio acetiphilus (strain DSM 12809 / NBRC 114555 / N2460) TaxID=522772 RepID=D4H1X2_DENA2|nr:response regulator [Denitrovibrio acetiphilus]ADD66949.1 response regulator receiver protein [Denitrovibrio acetiphilus DSM 12809]